MGSIYVYQKLNAIECIAYCMYKIVLLHSYVKRCQLNPAFKLVHATFPCTQNWMVATGITIAATPKPPHTGLSAFPSMQQPIGRNAATRLVAVEENLQFALNKHGLDSNLIPELKRLANFEIALVIENSVEMNLPSNFNGRKSRWQEVASNVEVMIDLCVAVGVAVDAYFHSGIVEKEVSEYSRLKTMFGNPATLKHEDCEKTLRTIASTRKKNPRRSLLLFTFSCDPPQFSCSEWQLPPFIHCIAIVSSFQETQDFKSVSNVNKFFNFQNLSFYMTHDVSDKKSQSSYAASILIDAYWYVTVTTPESHECILCCVIL